MARAAGLARCAPARQQVVHLGHHVPGLARRTARAAARILRARITICEIFTHGNRKEPRQIRRRAEQAVSRILQIGAHLIRGGTHGAKIAFARAAQMRIAREEGVRHGARLVQIQIHADAVPLRARNQPVQRRDARFPARGERRIEGKGRKLIEDALQPHAAHAHARVLGQQRVRKGIERGIAEWIAIEGEIGIHGAQPPVVCLSGNRLRRAGKRRDKIKPVFPCAQGHARFARWRACVPPLPA